MPSAPRVTPLVLRHGAQPRDPSPYYATFDVRGGGQTVAFHLLLDPGDPESDGVCQSALASFRKGLATTGRTSLTAALRTAFEACDRELAAANQGGVGLTCLAVRGDESYLAAVSDVAVFQRDGTGVRQVRPSVPGTMAPALGGGGGGVTVAMERLDLQPRQSILIASASLLSAVNAEGLDAVMAAAPAAAVEHLSALMDAAPCFLSLLLTPASA